MFQILPEKTNSIQFNLTFSVINCEVKLRKRALASFAELAEQFAKKRKIYIT